MYCWKDEFDDWRNDNRERNSYNTDELDYNCGGYALKTYNWYKPYDSYYDIDDLINNCLEAGYLLEDIEDEILDYMTEKVLEDFPNLVECDLETALSHKTSIALRYSNGFDEDDFDYCDPDWDFHFKLFENNHWSEKCGGNAIRECELIEKDAWVSRAGRKYTSRIVYFTYKEAL